MITSPDVVCLFAVVDAWVTDGVSATDVTVSRNELVAVSSCESAITFVAVRVIVAVPCWFAGGVMITVCADPLSKCAIALAGTSI